MATVLRDPLIAIGRNARPNPVWDQPPNLVINAPVPVFPPGVQEYQTATRLARKIYEEQFVNSLALFAAPVAPPIFSAALDMGEAVRRKRRVDSDNISPNLVIQIPLSADFPPGCQGLWTLKRGLRKPGQESLFTPLTILTAPAVVFPVGQQDWQTARRKAGRANVDPPVNLRALAAIAFAPTLLTISPISGARNTIVAVQFTGTNLDQPGLTVNISGTLVTAGTPYLVTATSFKADFTINVAAALTARNVTVTTSQGTSAALVFTITEEVTGGGGSWLSVSIFGHRRRGGG